MLTLDGLNPEEKCVLRVFYNFKEGCYTYDFGNHQISIFQLIGIIHCIQNELDCDIQDLSDGTNIRGINYD